jgi:DNA polymerase-3 subunit delta'
MNIIDLHSEVWGRLVARRAQLPHALLISGQRGIGKFELARLFADSLLCEQPTAQSTACGVCPACGWQAQGNHPDFRLLQPEALAASEGEGGESAGSAGKKKPSQQITIDQVRALDEFLHVGTHRQGLRVVLINPAEAMNRSTANSLLKSLEEPIPSTLFILVSSDSDRLLPTIRSRCQSMPVPQPAAERAKAWLAQAGVDDAGPWLALAGGSPLLAATLAASEARVLLEAVIAELGKGGRLDPLAAASAVDRVIKAEKQGAPLKGMIEWSQKWLHDLTLTCEQQPPRYFQSHAAALLALARTTSTANLLAFSRKTLQYRMQCEQPLNSRLFLEEFFLSYAAVFTVN